MTKPLIFTQGGKRNATLTPQEGKAGEVFTLGSAASCDVVVSPEYGLAGQQVSFAPRGSVWWIGDAAADGRLEVNGRRTALVYPVSTGIGVALAAVIGLVLLRLRAKGNKVF